MLVLDQDRSQVDSDLGGKRKQIVDGARKVFHGSGFDGASMNEIARVAGVSKGTLYVYFASKEELFEALIRQDKRAQAEQTCRIEHEGDDLRTTLNGIGLRLLTRLLEPELVAQLRTVIAVSAKFPRVGQAYYEAGPRFGRAKLAEYLQGQVEAGHLVIDDFEAASVLFIELCKGDLMLRAILAITEAVPPRPELQVHVARAVEAFLKIYGTPHSGPAGTAQLAPPRRS